MSGRIIELHCYFSQNGYIFLSMPSASILYFSSSITPQVTPFFPILSDTEERKPTPPRICSRRCCHRDRGPCTRHRSPRHHRFGDDACSHGSRRQSALPDARSYLAGDHSQIHSYPRVSRKSLIHRGSCDGCGYDGGGDREIC